MIWLTGWWACAGGGPLEDEDEEEEESVVWAPGVGATDEEVARTTSHDKHRLEVTTVTTDSRTLTDTATRETRAPPHHK